jgi:glycosyltransferase involved in cell wall biosynthesis
MKRASQNWLIIAHCMNMDGQAASHHVSDKLQYLTSSCISVTLLSAASGTRGSRYPHHQVFSPFPSGIKFELRHYIRLRVQNPILSEISLGILNLIIFPFYLLEKVFLPLDSQWSWFITAYFCGRKIINSQKIDLIYVLGGASSGFLAAHLLSKRSKIPFIAECFDPIISCEWRRSRFSFHFNKRIESLICKHAQAVAWYTHGAKNEALHRNPRLGDRGHVIRPGMEPPNFNGIEYRKTEKFKFSYFGGLSSERSLLPFIRAIYEILLERPEYSKIIELNVYGGELDQSSREFVKKNPCSFLKLHGRLEYEKVSSKSGRQQVLEKMRTSDVLVLIHGIGQITKLYIPSKTYEYLWAKRPILLLTPCPEEWTELLPEKEHFIIESGHQEKLVAGLHSFIDVWQNGGLPDCKLSDPLSAEEATQEIIKLAAKKNT